MKNIFDFKSPNTENSSMDKLLALIENKIHNSIVALLLTIVVGLSMIGLYIGFFVMPFITYSSIVLKIIFSILWGFSCIVFVIMAIDQSKQEKNDDKWGFITINIGLMVFLGLCLINNNYYYLGDWWQIAIVVVMGLYTVLMLYRFIKELIKNPRGTLSALFMGIMFVLGFLCILASSLTYLEIELRKKVLIIGAISIAIPVIAMLIAKILKISKAEKVLEYGLLVTLCIILLIGISSVISFLNPNVDGYQTFVTLFASFLGGGLTLLGVAWTIRKADDDRKQSEEQRAKPLVFICNPQMTSINKEELMEGILLSKRNIGSLKNAEADKVAFILPQIVVSNSDYSHVVLRGFRINDEYHLYDHGQVLPKNKAFNLHSDFRFEHSNKIEYIAMLLQDMLENIYELELNFSISKRGKNKIIIINSGIETRKTTLAINPKEI